VVAVLALAGAAIWVNRDNLGLGGADPTTPPANTGAATAPALPPDEQCTEAIQANDRWVCITQAFVDDTKFVVEYTAEWRGATPQNTGGFHLHIYGGDGTNPPASRMGYQSDQPGRFYLEDKAPSVRSVTGGNYLEIIGDNPKVCARISDAADILVKDKEGGYETGNCVTIQDRR
jgi:hypothetical protein